MRLVLLALALIACAPAPAPVAVNAPPCAAPCVEAPRLRIAYASIAPVPLLAQAPTIAPAPADSAPAPEPTPVDLANAVAAKAWPLATAVGIFLLTKLITAMGWVTGKGGKLVLLFLLTAGAAAVQTMALGTHWALAVLGSVTAGLTAIGIFSGGKNTLQAVGAVR